jgi:hypothetical protein
VEGREQKEITPVGCTHNINNNNKYSLMRGKENNSKCSLIRDMKGKRKYLPTLK